MIGGMGHSGMVALGFSLSRKNDVICLDGDGSLNAFWIIKIIWNVWQSKF